MSTPSTSRVDLENADSTLADHVAVDGHRADYRAITERQQRTWSAGDFSVIARQTAAEAEALVRRVDPHPGERVLDLACGSGNVALVAARRYCEAAGIDYVPALIERARARAEAELLDVEFHIGDVQNLPFGEASFNYVLSTFGVMFAPDQEKAAAELLRVCRPGGKIGLSCWMPEAFGEDFFGVHARYLPPPPPGAKPPDRWGTASGLEELIGPGTRSIQNDRRDSAAYFRSVDHAAAVFSNYFGPTIRALEAAGPDRREEFLDALKGVFRKYNTATDGCLILKTEYMQTVAIRA